MRFFREYYSIHFCTDIFGAENPHGDEVEIIWNGFLIWDSSIPNWRV